MSVGTGRGHVFPGALADRVGAAKGQLALSIYPVSPTRRLDLAQAATDAGLWVHVDVFRDDAGADLGVDLGTLSTLASSGKHQLDVHLIGSGGAAMLGDVLPLGCTRITLPLECGELADRAALVRSTGSESWVAIAPTSPVGDVERFVAAVDGALVMLLAPGTQEQADLSLLNRVRALAPVLPVGVDGSVAMANIDACLAAGARYVVVGRALLQRHSAHSDVRPRSPHAHHVSWESHQ